MFRAILIIVLILGLPTLLSANCVGAMRSLSDSDSDSQKKALFSTSRLWPEFLRRADLVLNQVKALHKPVDGNTHSDRKDAENIAKIAELAERASKHVRQELERFEQQRRRNPERQRRKEKRFAVQAEAVPETSFATK